MSISSVARGAVRAVRRWSAARLHLGLAELCTFVLLAVVLAVQTVYLLTYVSDQRRITDSLACQVQVNDAFREALTARTAASQRERAAQRVFLAVAGDGLDPSELRTYLAALDAADRDRANNPLPRGTC